VSGREPRNCSPREKDENLTIHRENSLLGEEKVGRDFVRRVKHVLNIFLAAEGGSLIKHVGSGEDETGGLGAMGVTCPQLILGLGSLAYMFY